MKHCLVVDDSRVVRKVICHMIAPLGFETHEAADGQEALRLLQQQPIDVVMLDWNMPVMDGIECVQMMRADAHIQQPIVIFCTTETEMPKIQQALAAGADEYVMKPFDEGIIRGKFEQLALI
jgi:two-component system chemotaxis response regulator CheY